MANKDPEVCLSSYQKGVIDKSLVKMREELSGKVTKDDAAKALATSERLARASLAQMCDLQKKNAAKKPGGAKP